MSFTLEEGTFTVFVNNKESEKQPDFKGKVMLNGKEQSIAMWKRESKKGNKYLFGKIEEFKPMPKEVKQAVTQDFNDDLPW